MDLRGSREFRLPVRVYYEDTDAAGIVYHANYLKFMERARTEWLRTLGFEQHDLAHRYQLAFVVRAAKLDFVRPARFDDQLWSICRIQRCGRASVDFAQEICAVDDTRLCGGEVRVGCVNFRQMAPMRMPDEIFLRIKDAC